MDRMYFVCLNKGEVTLETPEEYVIYPELMYVNATVLDAVKIFAHQRDGESYSKFDEHQQKIPDATLTEAERKANRCVVRLLFYRGRCFGLYSRAFMTALLGVSGQQAETYAPTYHGHWRATDNAIFSSPHPELV